MDGLYAPHSRLSRENFSVLQCANEVNFHVESLSFFAAAGMLYCWQGNNARPARGLVPMGKQILNAILMIGKISFKPVVVP